MRSKTAVSLGAKRFRRGGFGEAKTKKRLIHGPTRTGAQTKTSPSLRLDNYCGDHASDGTAGRSFVE